MTIKQEIVASIGLLWAMRLRWRRPFA